MSTKFVCFINPHTNKPMLVNPAHVRTASEVDPQKVALVMDGGLRQEVEVKISNWNNNGRAHRPAAPFTEASGPAELYQGLGPRPFRQPRSLAH